MSNLAFYFQHALRNLGRNRQRTLFTLFCIAIGVAAVVALRSLGLMIEATVLRNLQADLRGDLRISAPAAFGAATPIDTALVDAGSLFVPPTFTPAGLERITAWAEAQGWRVTAAQLNGNPARVRSAASTDRSLIVSPIFVEPDAYPFYAETPLVAPPGAPLAQALGNPRSVVLTAQTAERLGVGVGDAVYLTGAPDPFTVTALASDTAEASLTNVNSLLIPFVYLSRSEFNRRADVVFVQLPADAETAEAGQRFAAAFPGLPVVTVDDLRAANQTVTDWITRVATAAGLASLLIGGIGIINTMLVVVRRRALEIGVLKTVGLQGQQITRMFLVEALVLGLIGSIVGAGLGLALLRALQGLGEQLTARALQFAVYPEALLLGLATGVVVTLVFGFLPTLAAGRVRPNVVLNPGLDAPIPAAARLQTALVLAGLALIIGLLVGVVLRNLLLGIGVTLGVGAALAGLLGVLWVLVLILTILPTGGSIRLKLVQRAIASHRARTAGTLLALVVGLYALSLIVLLTRSLFNVIDAALNQQLGGNILAVAQTSEAVREVQRTAADLPGVRAVIYDEIFAGVLTAVDGEPLETRLEAARAAGLAAQTNLDPATAEARVELILRTFIDNALLQKRSPRTNYQLGAGRDIDAQTQRGIVLPEGDATRWLGIGVGSSVTLRLANGVETTLTVVGLSRLGTGVSFVLAQSGAAMPNTGIISDDAIPADVAPQPGSLVIDADPAALESVVQALAALPEVVVFEATLLQSFITTIVDQLTALPLAVAGLALFAGGLIIANTVSLATLERRREIGVMKALGLTTGQVLSLLLIENGVLGLLGGVLGVSVAAALSLTAVLQEPGGLAQFPWGALLGLIASAVAVALLATLFTAVGAARTRPLEVLRYE